MQNENKFEEIFDTVDQNGKIIGSATRSEVHGNPKLIHRSVHVLVIFANQEAGDKLPISAHQLFLQKRSRLKDIQPGKWDTSVGGHVGRGEDITAAARREMREELGIVNREIKFLYRYLWRSALETELVSSFLCHHAGPFNLQSEEISEGHFWSFYEIEEHLGSGVFTPNFEVEFGKLKTYLNDKNISAI